MFPPRLCDDTNANTCITKKTMNIPLWYEADVCAVGGSAAGVFAAVRAARLRTGDDLPYGGGEPN